MGAHEVFTVHLVVAPDYSDGISSLAQSEAAWVVNTPQNERALAEVAPEYYRRLIRFDPVAGRTPEQLVILALEPIHLQHPSPPFSELNVIGAIVSSELQTELDEYGFIGFDETAEGFRAYKDVPRR